MGFLSDIFGSKPTVPALPKLSLPAEQQTAIQANISALPAAEKMTAATNQFTQAQITQMLQSVIPNYNQITGQATTDITSMLKGEVPTDVAQQIQSSTAAQALSGGFAGSGMHGALTARDLGLTSLNLMQQGISTAESWTSMMDKMYQPGMVNVASMFVTPAQQAAFDVQQTDAQFQRQWLQNQISAMPDPVTVGLWNTGWSVVDAALSAYTGSSVDLGRVNPQGSAAGIGTQPSPGAGEGGAAFDQSSAFAGFGNQPFTATSGGMF